MLTVVAHFDGSTGPQVPDAITSTTETGDSDAVDDRDSFKDWEETYDAADLMEDSSITVAQSSQNDSQDSEFMQRIHTLEAWLGAFSGTLLSLVFVCALVLPNQLAIKLPVVAYLGIVFLCASLLEGPFLFRVWAATLKGERPIGPAVARRTRTWPLVLRVPAAAWWFFHVVPAMLIIIGGEVQALRMAGKAGMIALALVTMLLFSMSVCCNVFIALFVKALFGTDSAVERFWRWRLIVDAIVTAVAMLIAARM